MNKLVRISPSTNNLTISTLVFLSIAYNRLEVVPTEALKSFPNLRILILHSNQIHTIAPDAFKYNGKITHLSIGPNPVVDFNGEWMTGMNLMYLSLNSMGIRIIPEQFKEMTNLMWTNLASNKIRRINASTSLKLTQLDTIYLANNEIEYIDKDAFKGAVKLRDIDLSDNRIQTLDKGTFKDMKGENLVLNLLENPLGCDCNTAWFKSWTDEVGAQNLATDIRYKCYQPARNHGKKPSQLTLDDFTCRSSDVIWEDCNQPQPIGRPSSTLLTTSTASTHLPDIDVACPSMCSCYDENGILYHSPPNSHSNDEGWMHWMSKSYPMVNCNTANLDRIPLGIRKDVKTLTLSGNHLKLLDVGEISQFPDLEKLDLKKNMIMTIRTSPAMMPKLTFLNLRLNNISGLSKTHLKSFPNLEVLTLQHNNITKIPNDLFKYNRKLIRLYIGPNPIKSFQSNWLGTLSLRSLALRNVSLTKIPSQLLLQKNLTYVDMSDNYITTIRNKTFSKLTKLKWLILENNRIANIQANAFNGATSLRMIDLSENNLKTLPGSVFSNISKERLNIELWENQFMCDCKMKDLKIWIEKMEALDPMADIRFKCKTPTRMHEQVSDQLNPEDFVCQNGDSDVVIGSICKACPNPTGQIILAIVLTFIFTLLMGIIAWKCTFRRRYGDLLQYAKARNDNGYDEEF
nr:slit homolog 3 protein isoform X2 [Ciona intestinalis]XP_026693342.1 slit homolog 3 protein isoform X2 [Ciona intestinalis]|eukprot:XP_009860830.1 slit homolog 3 protein isoform X2 [Ciona intestinalis]